MVEILGYQILHRYDDEFMYVWNIVVVDVYLRFLVLNVLEIQKMSLLGLTFPLLNQLKIGSNYNHIDNKV